MNLHNGADLKNLSEDELIRNFGKAGRFYYNIVRGIDDREVQAYRETKSLAAEDTFAYDLSTLAEMESELENIARIVSERLQKKQMKGRTITLKIKYSDFRQITRNKSFAEPIDDQETISIIAGQLLAATFQPNHKIRLLGISLSNFGMPESRKRDEKGSDQLKLF